MLKNILYAFLLGVGMAACLADHDKAGEGATTTSTTTESGPLTEAAEPRTSPAVIDPADLVLGKGRAGAMRIGMPIEEMRSQVPAGQQIRDTTLQLEGQQYTAYVISASESPQDILVEQICKPDCQVWRINIRDPNYRTAQGIGVGSKYSEVAQHHPIAYTSLGEAGFVAVSEKSGMSFILDSSQLDQSRLHQLKPDQVPANTLVQGILIY
ncbi:mechanosensitive ion channel protein MscS [Pontibacter sp. BT731]|uniref:mechanosensitive ion channel protein MscS n=1 Tax=Pontibacter coccineus TaxID=3063328 RepID=UPI0026E42FC1|nr:mechanosensitive ion channel protein MscS [Pontibacter sp. BT731]MDO6390266.1 mechanosensitive ion channel protein MscS [Pontibacter sp. BT731]